MKSSPDDWTGQARAVLDASAQGLDAATLSRLNRARQQALAAATPARPALRWTRRLAIATSLLLAVTIWWPDSGPAPTAPNGPPLSPEDAELLADGALEMTDDPEFYAWLDADADHNG
jgi:hypothetical protein